VKRDSSLSGPAIFSIAFPSLFFLVVLRAPLAILGDPGWICGMKGDQPQCEFRDGRGIDQGGIRAENKHDTRKVVLYIDSSGQVRSSSAQNKHWHMT
jgi:hypothetical protein